MSWQTPDSRGGFVWFPAPFRAALALIVALPAGLLILATALTTTGPDANTAAAQQLQRARECAQSGDSTSDPGCVTHRVGTAAAVHVTRLAKGCYYSLQIEFDDGETVPADLYRPCGSLRDADRVVVTWWRGAVVAIATPGGHESATAASPLPREQSRQESRTFGLASSVGLLSAALLGLVSAFAAPAAFDRLFTWRWPKA
jgi:hypothetical protein